MTVAMLRPQTTPRTVTAEIIDLTPEKAAAILRNNNRNRPMRDRYAKRLASAMTRGEWKFNGDTIVVADTGELLQGQHRCTAVVLSGVTIKTILVEGVPEECFDTYDRGIGRTGADVFSIAGISNAKDVAAITRLICIWNATENPFSFAQEMTPTIQQLEEKFFEDKDRISKSASFANNSKWCKKHITPSVSGFCHYVFCLHNEKRAVEFFESLESGSLLSAGSPVLALRERLIDDRDKKGRLAISYKTALVFKAFKLYLDDASIKYLRVRTEGDGAEKNIYII